MQLLGSKNGRFTVHRTIHLGETLMGFKNSDLTIDGIWVDLLDLLFDFS